MDQFGPSSPAIVFQNFQGGSKTWYGCIGPFDDKITQSGFKLDQNGLNDKEFVMVFDSATSRQKYRDKCEWMKVLLENTNITSQDVEVNLQKEVIVQNLDKFNFYPPKVRHKHIKWNHDDLSKFIILVGTDEGGIGELRDYLSPLPTGCKTKSKKSPWSVCSEHISQIDFVKNIAVNCLRKENQRELFEFAKEHIKSCESFVSEITNIEILLDFPVDLDEDQKKNNYLEAFTILQDLHHKNGWNTSLFLVSHLFNLATKLMRIHATSETRKLFQLAEEVLSKLERTSIVSRLTRSSKMVHEWIAKSHDAEQTAILNDVASAYIARADEICDDKEYPELSTSENSAVAEQQKDMEVQHLNLNAEDNLSKDYDIKVGDIISVISDTEMTVCYLGGTPINVSLDSTEVFFDNGRDQKKIDNLFSIDEIDMGQTAITMKIRESFLESHDYIIESIYIYDEQLLNEGSNDHLGVFLSDNRTEIEDVDENFDDVMEEFEDLIRSSLPNHISNNRQIDFKVMAKKIVGAWREDEWFEAYFEGEIFKCYNDATGKYILPEDINEERITNDVNYKYSLYGKVPGISKKTICILTSNFMIQKAREFCREKEKSRNSIKIKSTIIEEISSDSENENDCIDMTSADEDRNDECGNLMDEFMEFSKRMCQKIEANTSKASNGLKSEIQQLNLQLLSQKENLNELMKENEKLKIEAEYLKNRNLNELEDREKQMKTVEELSERLKELQDLNDELKKGSDNKDKLIDQQAKEIEKHRQRIEEEQAEELKIVLVSSNHKSLYNFLPDSKNLLPFAVVLDKCPSVTAIKYPHDKV